MKYASAHAIVRDDGMYLDEWIRYHESIGFEHFVIYDHDSDVPVVNQWGDLVEVIPVHLTDMTQWPKIFDRTLKTLDSVWLATLDIDEFIVLNKHKDIKELLPNYIDYGGLGINWMCYGSGGHENIPSTNVKDSYLWRCPTDYPANAHVRTIAQMKYCKDFYNVHTCTSTKPLVNEDYGPAHGLSDSSRTLTRINHYITRSREDYQRKIDTGKKSGFDNWSMNRFDEIQKHSNTFDDVLKDWELPDRGHHYGIDGWFNFEALYDEIIGRFNKGIFVEVGCWKGRSTVYMADQIIKSGKKIKFYAVDIWEPFTQEDGVLFHSPMEEFLRNIDTVKEIIHPVKGSSHDAHTLFSDQSIDFLFIDANHDYEYVIKDIQLWYPKVKKGGVIAGHDYQFRGVKQAVDEFFGERNNLKYYQTTSSWFVDK